MDIVEALKIGHAARNGFEVRHPALQKLVPTAPSVFGTAHAFNLEDSGLLGGSADFRVFTFGASFTAPETGHAFITYTVLPSDNLASEYVDYSAYVELGSSYGTYRTRTTKFVNRPDAHYVIPTGASVGCVASLRPGVLYSISMGVAAYIPNTSFSRMVGPRIITVTAL